VAGDEITAGFTSCRPADADAPLGIAEATEATIRTGTNLTRLSGKQSTV